MDNTGTAIASLFLELHTSTLCVATALSKSAVASAKKWLSDARINYRKFVPFSPALGKLTHFRRNRLVAVEICAVPFKYNLLFAQVFLSRDIFKGISPIVDRSEAAQFVAAHFKTAAIVALLATFTSPRRKRTPVRMRLPLKRGGGAVSCKLRLKYPVNLKGEHGYATPIPVDAGILPTPKQPSPMDPIPGMTAQPARLVGFAVSSPCAGCVKVETQCDGDISVPRGTCEVTPVDANTPRNGSPVTIAPPLWHGPQVAMCPFVGCTKCDVKLAVHGVDREQFRLVTVVDV